MTLTLDSLVDNYKESASIDELERCIDSLKDELESKLGYCSKEWRMTLTKTQHKLVKLFGAYNPLGWGLLFALIGTFIIWFLFYGVWLI